MPPGALDGVKVLDLSQDIAGSFCARLLADYGAEVLKLEPPGGAALRRMGPFFQDDPHPEKSLFFLVLNLNKKGATINLESATGRAIFKELIEHVDVVVESYQPGYLASLGLGYDDLEQLNPGLVMTSITPFGQDGPYSQYQGEEIVSYAMGMIMSVSGIQGREPLKHGGFQAQYEGGLNGAAATAMALFSQVNTGEGQHIDVSVTECVASSMMATQTMYPFMGGTQHRRRAQGGMFTHPMACADGWIIVQTGGGASWEDICDLFEAPEMMDPRFSDPAQRPQNGAELDRIIVDAIKDRSKWDLFPKAAQARILFGVVQTPRELVECPQLASRDFFREVDHPVIGRIKVPAVLFNFSVSPYQLRCPSPTLGQNNQEIYVEGLGYSQEDFCRLRQLNAI
ncbi:MAG: CoA transferase [Chloroflexi bacterium]|nr:CoA transferase [Chloroflexota bacterium]MCI0797718.1 CoA transferase [Chloroflexota bacterium]MCI0824380.1 CoA transferase [Chloroflexota bacterium]MCI0857812.1 CoA transferase [Chloroflexota bacterium]MCI0893477.1 CoA transferase [Chloroflexota bacterium]